LALPLTSALALRRHVQTSFDLMLGKYRHEM